MDQKGFHTGRMEDLAAAAVKKGCAASRFLTPAEREATAAYFSRRQDVTLLFDGGFDEAERVRAIFLQPDWGSFERDSLLAGLSITCRDEDAPGHRDVLGALMALGLSRDTIGDIHTENGSAALVCLPNIKEHIMENLCKIGRVGVQIHSMLLENLPQRREILQEKTDTVASLRLDAVLGAAFGLSRSHAAEQIAAGLVSLNHVVCLQPAKPLTTGAVLSLRGIGRAVLQEVGGLSKKGRIFVRFGLYGR